MKTFIVKKNIINRTWYLIDAKNKILGRLSSKISNYLMGKNKSIYTPYIDTGDYLVIINASKILVTGNKLNNKCYFYHTGYPGGIKKISLKKMLKDNPVKVIQKSIKGMLPKGSLGRKMFLKLRIYSGKMHKHNMQKPKILNL
ncbi:50S ribosomal protein L13 [Candidatus Annandia adelgestsuga]|uniref:Large ribosomal subunit protein uL13 n=1 Tax=Candidatus Annandia adelgestsuga TaxID=1302411 RepID=A0A3Q9CLY0_9ENTR|nr:50S ribosomal protein L13 [Candidatus Annandia adelgestsuga]AZP36297.1 50S ribosomal protein L13 [Candidatus Annandia adelgestsuga]